MISLAVVSLLVIPGSSALLFAGVLILRWLQVRDQLLLTAVVAVTYALVLHLEPHWSFVSDVVVFAMALVAGALIGSTLRSDPAIIAFCVAAAVVDVLSFSGGLTSTIVESYRTGESQFLFYLSIAFPVGGSVRPIVGIGDLIILGGPFAGFINNGHHSWLPFAVPVGGLLAAVGVGVFVGGTPALPFVAAATVTYVLSRRSVKTVAV
jgi:hypothetical protein